MCACECKWQKHKLEDHSNKKRAISKNDVRYVQNIGTIFFLLEDDHVEESTTNR